MTVSFSRKINQMAVDHCRQYLSNYKTNFPADYAKTFGTCDKKLKFKQTPSVKTVSASCGNAVIFPVIILKGDAKLAQYSLLRDKSGHCCDDWLDVIV